MLEKRLKSLFDTAFPRLDSTLFGGPVLLVEGTREIALHSLNYHHREESLASNTKCLKNAWQNFARYLLKASLKLVTTRLWVCDLMLHPS